MSSVLMGDIRGVIMKHRVASVMRSVVLARQLLTSACPSCGLCAALAGCSYAPGSADQGVNE